MSWIFFRNNIFLERILKMWNDNELQITDQEEEDGAPHKTTSSMKGWVIL